MFVIFEYVGCCLGKLYCILLNVFSVDVDGWVGVVILFIYGLNCDWLKNIIVVGGGWMCCYGKIFGVVNLWWFIKVEVVLYVSS